MTHKTAKKEKERQVTGQKTKCTRRNFPITN